VARRPQAARTGFSHTGLDQACDRTKYAIHRMESRLSQDQANASTSRGAGDVVDRCGRASTWARRVRREGAVVNSGWRL